MDGLLRANLPPGQRLPLDTPSPDSKAVAWLPERSTRKSAPWLRSAGGSVGNAHPHGEPTGDGENLRGRTLQFLGDLVQILAPRQQAEEEGDVALGPAYHALDRGHTITPPNVKAS